MITILKNWDSEHINKQTLFFEYAQAYLESSIHHFESMVGDLIPKTYFHALVGELLFVTALENFFRGSCVEKYKEKRFPSNHNLQRDYDMYKELHKGKELELKINMSEIVRQLPQRKDSTFQRYPTNREGKRWFDNRYISPEVMAEKLPEVKAEFDRIIRKFEKDVSE